VRSGLGKPRRTLERTVHDDRGRTTGEAPPYREFT